MREKNVYEIKENHVGPQGKSGQRHVCKSCMWQKLLVGGFIPREAH